MSKPRPNNDLWYALAYNTPHSFKKEDIEDIVAEVSGANDELSWWWVIRLKSGDHVLFSGWCDYTGWDCQSGIDLEARSSDSLDTLTLNAPMKENYSNRAIREVLRAQLAGVLPYGLYDSAYENN